MRCSLTWLPWLKRTHYTDILWNFLVSRPVALSVPSPSFHVIWGQSNTFGVILISILSETIDSMIWECTSLLHRAVLTGNNYAQRLVMSCDVRSECLFYGVRPIKTRLISAFSNSALSRPGRCSPRCHTETLSCYKKLFALTARASP